MQDGQPVHTLLGSPLSQTTTGSGPPGFDISGLCDPPAPPERKYPEIPYTPETNPTLDGQNTTPSIIAPMPRIDKRAEHNAIERARREGLNARFQQLAHLLPNIQHDQRPSKGHIIEQAMAFTRECIQNEEKYRIQIEELQKENNKLRMHTGNQEPSSSYVELESSNTSPVMSVTQTSASPMHSTNVPLLANIPTPFNNDLVNVTHYPRTFTLCAPVEVPLDIVPGSERVISGAAISLAFPFNNVDKLLGLKLRNAFNEDKVMLQVFMAEDDLMNQSCG
ncbi:hypothetical protein BC940DRAFT_318314 [Gongronella butleri]|nr:hypothetical protein BC940DRAFT_318314 [Gongronella butleri]